MGEVVIVGGGLSGLFAALRLQDAGRDYRVFEARERWGGRILSEDDFDLGPAWIWPQNRRMLALIRRLGLELFEQHSAGRLVFQDGAGAVRRDLDFATMGGALRVAGGLGALVDAMLTRLDPARLSLGHRVRSVEVSGTSVQLRGTAPQAFDATTDAVVLALPPRVLARDVTFDPPLPPGAREALAAVPGWMAGQAKVLAVYDRPFWRDAGLNGDAISHRGPLVEVHDASPADATAGALFGFVGWPAGQRDPAALQSAALAQLAALFGAEAGTPRRLIVKDWASAAFTATAADLQPLASHPDYRPIPGLDGARLRFAGTELAPADGGFLEGALSAAEAALAGLVPAATAA